MPDKETYGFFITVLGEPSAKLRGMTDKEAYGFFITDQGKTRSYL